MEAPKRSPFTKDYFLRTPFKIGDYSYGVPNVRWWGEAAQLTIGRYCSIGKDVTIFLGGNHRVDWVTTYPFMARGLVDYWTEATGIKGCPISKGDITIGNDVWIGEFASIFSGVTIGDGAVIAGCSVVTKDVAPYEIVGGNPAKHIRLRFERSVVERLQKLRWWDWDEATVRQYIPMLCDGSIEAFLRVAETLALGVEA